MRDWIRRVLRFARFTLREYIRSGRVLVEIITMLVVLWMFFWPRGKSGLEASWFFGMVGLYLTLLASYTVFMIMRLGNRPQGYLLLSRDLGRSGYFVGLYMASLIVVLITYMVFSLGILVLWSTRPAALSFVEWLLGSTLILLNASIMMAFIAFITPLVLTTAPRLIVLGLLVLALGRDVDIFGNIPGNEILYPVEAVLGLPLVPMLSGFALATDPQISWWAGLVMLEQLLLALAITGCALVAFERRELILAT